MNSGPRVLVVDDECSGAFARALEREGCDVTRAVNYAEAVAAVNRVKYDAVLIDLLLPDGDGADLVAVVRRSQPAARAAVVSAHATAAVAVQLLVDGVPLLPKPIAHEELCRLVNQLVADTARVPLLSAREAEVLRLARAGLALKQISENLGITLSTVKTYFRRVREKARLSAHDTPPTLAAAAAALERSLRSMS